MLTGIEQLLGITDAIRVEGQSADPERALRALLRAYFKRVMGDLTDLQFAEALSAGASKKIGRSAINQIKNGVDGVTVQHLARLARFQRK